MLRKEQLVIVRGGGDLATGVIHRLHRCGYPVLVLETGRPSAIRRQVALSEAVYDGCSTVEGVTCRKCTSWEQARELLTAGEEVPLLVDPAAAVLDKVKPWALIDAIIAKRNLGTTKKMAPKTIALGPGFAAGEDVDLVIETMRGQNLGRILEKGGALADTKTPGNIAGFNRERVLHAPCAGIFQGNCRIGDLVQKGQVVAWVETREGRVQVPASLTGLLRGLLRTGYQVTAGFKVGDIDPRQDEYKNCFTISDKARNLAGSVLESLLYLEQKQGC